jgi:hypothetical protein
VRFDQSAVTPRTPAGIIRKSALWKLCRPRYKFQVVASSRANNSSAFATPKEGSSEGKTGEQDCE